MTPLDRLGAVRQELFDAGHTAWSVELHKAWLELHATREPDGDYFRAWARIANTLSDVRPGWRDEVCSASAIDSAVAAIRSMVAQCSAQSAPPIPFAWPEPVQGWPSLYYATGYMNGCGRPDVAADLEQIGEWLRKYGCDQIR